MAPIPETIIGHQKQLGQLLQDVASRNISHAYLFAGQPKLGKCTVARWFAWMILADHVAPEERQGVRDQMERMIHADFLCMDDLWMEDVQDDWKVIGLTSNVPQQHRSKAPAAKTDIISIEDIRALSERLHDTGESPYLCCIIRGVERMQAAAANAFLKMLEEPPKRVVFILTTDSFQSLLPTIVSRTRVLKFSPLKESELRPLAEGRDEDEAAFALHIAQGAPGAVAEMLADPELLRERRQLHAQCKRFWQTSSLKDRLSWLLPAAEKKHETGDVLFHLGVTLRELPASPLRATQTRAYSELVRALKTNAHKALLLERFALAAGGEE